MVLFTESHLGKFNMYLYSRRCQPFAFLRVDQSSVYLFGRSPFRVVYIYSAFIQIFAEGEKYWKH